MGRGTEVRRWENGDEERWAAANSRCDGAARSRNVAIEEMSRVLGVVVVVAVVVCYVVESAISGHL
jgi:hypothetical protein